MPNILRLTTCLAVLVFPALSVAQRGADPNNPLQQAAQLDLDGKTREARAIYLRVIDTTSDPARKANAQRSLAMSYAFDGDCGNTVKYEDQVIAYWKGREQAEPQNA